MTGRSPDRPGGLAMGVPENGSFTVGDNITIWVTKARGGWTSIVIDAPRDLKIRRHGRTTPTEGGTDGTEQGH